jgi:hypothetical protein
MESIGALELRRSDVHEIDVDGSRLLLHVPTTSLFELDAVGAELFDLFRDRPTVTEGRSATERPAGASARPCTCCARRSARSS